ncbi:MAG: CBS domain-containing protein [Candidatus Hodarchaeales archaeon]|jgi:CBS domain-containing protein
MELDLTAKILVREAMSSPVLSVFEDQNITDIAHMMREGRVGAIIITNKEGQPIGIVTERDIVNRVVAEGGRPNIVKAREIMTAPLKMVEPEMNLMDAMRLMDKMNIRRLGVTYKGELVGIISDRNIIRLVPTIVEIIKEKREINKNHHYRASTVGYCTSCEIYSMNLRDIDGEFLCEDCIEE